eukprot:s4746_g5.t1
MFRCVFGLNTSGKIIDPSSGVRCEAPPRSDFADKPPIPEFEDCLGTTEDLGDGQSILVLRGLPDVQDMEVPMHRTGVTGRDVFRLLSEVRIGVFHMSSFGWRNGYQEGCERWAAADGVVGSAYSDEVMITESEKPRYLQNIDLGLKDSDAAAHSPLVVVSKLHCKRNLRTRSDQSDQRRKDRRPWRRQEWQEEQQDWQDDDEEEEEEPVSHLRSTTPSSGARYHSQDTGARSSGAYENTARVPVAPPKTPPIPPPSARRRERSATPTERNTQRRPNKPQQRPQRPQSPRPPPQRSWHQQQQDQYNRYNQPYARAQPGAAASVPLPPHP